MKTIATILGFLLLVCSLLIFGCSNNPTETEDSVAGTFSGYTFDTNKIRLLSNSHSLKCLYRTALGLPKQIDQLPDGRIVIADPNNNRIVLVDGENVSTLIDTQNLNPHVVTALFNGLICYSTYGGRIYTHNPDTGEEALIGSLYVGGNTNALGSDSEGNIYAVSSDQRLHKFTPNGTRKIIVETLGFEDLGYAITDIDIAQDGTIYIGGFRKVVEVDTDGNLIMIADNLHNEPVWVEVTPDGFVYINEISQGLQKYNPIDGSLQQIYIENHNPFGDVIAPSAQKIIFYDFEVYYTYSFQTNSSEPLLRIFGNSFAFSAGADGKVYYSTPGNPPVINSVLMCLDWHCNIEEHSQVSFEEIVSIDVDFYNTIYLASNSAIYSITESDNTQMIISSRPDGLREISVDANNNIFVITSNMNNAINVYKYDQTGSLITLPISFNAGSFNGGISVHDAAIDVSSEGWIAIIVTGLGSYNNGPYFQRVYRANGDGSDLTLLANLDCQRVGGMVDIAVAPTGDIFVLAVTGTVGSSDVIYKLGSNGGNLTPFIDIRAGNDPKSIDVDEHGNLWFCTTTGIFIAEPN